MTPRILLLWGALGELLEQKKLDKCFDRNTQDEVTEKKCLAQVRERRRLPQDMPG